MFPSPLRQPNRTHQADARDLRVAIGPAGAELGLIFSKGKATAVLWQKGTSRVLPDRAGRHMLFMPCTSNGDFFALPTRPSGRIVYNQLDTAHFLAGPANDLLFQLHVDRFNRDEFHLVVDGFARPTPEAPYVHRGALSWSWLDLTLAARFLPPPGGNTQPTSPALDGPR